MKKRKIFVSLDIPDKLKDVAKTKLKDFYNNPLTRITKRENMHITVVFCGYLSEQELEKLKKETGRIAGEIKKFELTPKRIVFAPPHKKTKSMVWITFKNSPGFTNLSEKFSIFADKDMKETFPHITLSRFKDFYYPELKKLLPEDGIYFKDKTGAFEASSINIMESISSPNGHKYELIKKYDMI